MPRPLEQIHDHAEHIIAQVMRERFDPEIGYDQPIATMKQQEVTATVPIRIRETFLGHLASLPERARAAQEDPHTGVFLIDGTGFPKP